MNTSKLRPCAFLLFLLLLWQGCLAAAPGEMEVRKALVVEDRSHESDFPEATRRAGSVRHVLRSKRVESAVVLLGPQLRRLIDQTNFDGDDKAWAAVMEERVLAWPKMAPKSAMASIQVVAALRNRAWKKRGQGWAREVPPESWRAFQMYVEQARVYLERTKSVSATAMPWYGQMLEIAMRRGRSERNLSAGLRALS